jgi:uncharacterized protein YjdB
MDRAELIAAIQQRADAIRARSTSPAVDTWADEIRALAQEITRLEPIIIERRAQIERRIRDVDGMASHRLQQRRAVVTRPTTPFINAFRILTPNSTSVSVGATLDLDVHGVLKANERLGQNEVVVDLNPSVTWTSASTGVATVNASTGVVTGVSAGTAAITATGTGGLSGVFATITIAVEGIDVGAVTVSPSTGQLNGSTSETLQLTATVTDRGGATLSGRTINWSSSNTNRATVSAAGLVTAKSTAGAGSVTITAEDDDSSVTGTCSITVNVTPITPTAVVATPSSISNVVGSQVQITAVTNDQNSQPISGRSYTYSSNNNAVATVSATGLVTLVIAGTATITVSDTADSPTADTIAVTSITPSEGTAASRVGRDPIFMWRKPGDPSGLSSRQYRWERMRNEGHWLAVEFEANATATGTSGVRYGDDGFFCAWMYLVTGTQSWCDKAYQQFWDPVYKTSQTGWDGAVNWTADYVEGNFFREAFIRCVILCDWIYGGLSSQQKTNIATALNTMANGVMCVGTTKYVGGFGLADSDGMVGGYGGLALLHYWNVAENGPSGTNRYLNTLNQSWTSSSSAPAVNTGDPKFGALVTTTGAPPDTRSNSGGLTVRQFIRYYVENFGSGSWMESTEYNPGTSQLYITMVEALRGALQDATLFEEYDAWIESTADYLTHSLVQDLSNYIPWGDNESCSTWKYPAIWQQFAHRAGVLAGTQRGKWCQKMQNELYALYPATTRANAHLNRRVIWTWDPYAPAETADWPWVNGYSAKGATGAGHVTIQCDRNGIQSSTDLRAVTAMTYVTGSQDGSVDHNRDHWCDFLMWREGESVLHHPIHYGAVAIGPKNCNGILCAGLGEMFFRDTPVYTYGADFTAVTARMSGVPYRPDYYNPPPAFIPAGGANRCMVHWRDAGTNYDVLVIRDDLVINDPRNLNNYTRYTTADQSSISASFARTGGATKELMFYGLSGLSFGAGQSTWSTPNGQSVLLKHLLPTTYSRSTVSAAAWLTGWSSDVAPQAELTNRQVILVTNSEVVASNTTDTFLHVILVGSGTQPNVVKNADNSVAIGSSSGTRTVTWGGNTASVS